MSREAENLSSRGIIEVIPARNGKIEDKLVLIGTVLVIAIAFLLLSVLYSHKHHANAFVPKALRQHLINLSNAAEEISMVTELEGRLPSLAMILDLGIVPFAKNTLPGIETLTWRQYNNCFLTRTSSQNKHYQLRLTMLNGRPKKYELAWRLARNIEPLAAEACESNKQDWQIIDKYNRLNQEQHEH